VVVLNIEFQEGRYSSKVRARLAAFGVKLAPQKFTFTSKPVNQLIATQVSTKSFTKSCNS
jgi:hypothetical protein